MEQGFGHFTDIQLENKGELKTEICESVHCVQLWAFINLNLLWVGYTEIIQCNQTYTHLTCFTFISDSLSINIFPYRYKQLLGKVIYESSVHTHDNIIRKQN